MRGRLTAPPRRRPQGCFVREEEGEQQLCLVTEFCEGGSLQANLRQRRVSWWRHGRRIALDVARALAYLHAKRLVHLDVKSSNVLLSRAGTAKVRAGQGGAAGTAACCQCDPRLPQCSPRGALLTTSRPALPCPALQLGDLGMAKLLVENYVTGTVGTLAWCACACCRGSAGACAAPVHAAPAPGRTRPHGLPAPCCYPSGRHQRC